MADERKKIISIIGTTDAADLVLKFAEKLGSFLVDNGYRIATGGIFEIMEAVSKNARWSKITQKWI